jgi:hypothetical protein
MRHAAMIAPIVTANPNAAGGLIAAAKHGTVALREACADARGEYEDDVERSTRQHRQRSFRMWTGDDEMLEGRFALTPEIGGQVKAVLERLAQQRFGAGPDRIDQVTADVFTDFVIRNGITVVTINTNADPDKGDPSQNGDPSHGSDSYDEQCQPQHDEATDNPTTVMAAGCRHTTPRRTSSQSPAADAGLFDDTDYGSTSADETVASHHTANPTPGSGSTNSYGAPQPGTVSPFNPRAVPGKNSAVKATVHIVIDHSALVRGNTLPGESCELVGVGKVNVQWVQQLLGNAFVTAIIKNGKDITTVAHFKRNIPAELRTALIAGGRECVIENCQCRGYLEIDHQDVDFAKGGPTAWWNVDWMCSQHHRLKSSGWILGPPNPVTGKRQLHPPPSRTG